MIKKAILLLSLSLSCSYSFAVTECTAKVLSTVMVDGELLLVTDRAPAAYMPSSNSSLKYAYAAVLTAIASDKNVVVTFAADSVACNPSGAVRRDLSRVWITR